MRQYRYDHLSTEAGLRKCIEYLHRTCHQLCHDVFGRYLPIAGNVGIFCHSADEFGRLLKLKDELTNSVPNYNNKYFPLKEPITVKAEGKIPGATYEYLYIRKPDSDHPQVGDIDFVLKPAEHEAFKQGLGITEFRNKARIFRRLEDNMIELFDPKKDVFCYVVTGLMRDKIKGSQ